MTLMFSKAVPNIRTFEEFMKTKTRNVQSAGFSLDNDVANHIRKLSRETEVPMARIASNALRAHFRLPKKSTNGEPKPAA